MIPPEATLVKDTGLIYWKTDQRSDCHQVVVYKIEGLEYTEEIGSPPPFDSKPSTASEYASFRAGLAPPSTSPPPAPPPQ